MSTTIRDLIKQAKINFVDNTTTAHKEAGRIQLKQADTLLDKGYPLDFEVTNIIKKYDDLEKAPDYNTQEEETEPKKPRDKKGQFKQPDQEGSWLEDKDS